MAGVRGGGKALPGLSGLARTSGGFAAGVLSVGTAVPAHVIAREEARAAAARIFAGLAGRDRLLGVFDRSGVESRRFSFPLEYYERPRGFGERNDDYIRMAVELGAAAVRNAEVDPAGVDHLVFVTTTGLATPSIDARLVGRVGFSARIRRTPIYGVGCAGGVLGLARAAELARTGARVLLLSVELPGQTFDPEDVSKRNLVASAIFGEGAAAVLVGQGPGPWIVDSESVLLPGTTGAMGWAFQDGGPRLVLSPGIPGLIRRHVGAEVRGFLGRNGLSPNKVRIAAHPGGPKVLEAIRAALGLESRALDPSRRLLRAFGNLSSASVLFILKDLLRQARSGEAILVLGVGPGFSIDQVLIRV